VLAGVNFTEVIAHSLPAVELGQLQRRLFNELLINVLTRHVVFRPFRKYDLKQGGKSWDSVDRLDRGCIYQEVCNKVLLGLLITNV